ncbi:MAG: sigma-70 family RNA polymerase sigma factor [Planctomycetota bacterium]
MTGVTEILHAIGRGDRDASEELLAIVYDELRRLASRKLASEAPGQTLQTTALVHEAYLRLLPPSKSDTAKEDDTETADASPTGTDSNEAARENNGGEESPAGHSWNSRSHFFGAAAEAMRRILIDNARKKKRIKRGGDRGRVEFDDVDPASPESDVDLLALNEALTKLEQHDPAKADIVKLRYFAGLTLEDAAAALGVSVPTVQRGWRYARAWLRREMEPEQ